MKPFPDLDFSEKYYPPFGLKIAGISSVKFDAGMEGSLKNNNLYNDKELWDDADLDWYDYGFRNYDPQIGRFTQLDPLTDDYPELTPYQYASNDPILNIDLDGLEGVISNVSKVAEDAVTTSGTLLAEVKIFAVLPKAAKAGTSILSKVGTLMNAVGKGIGWFGKGLWNEGVMPTLDWVNHNANPVYGVFNGVNSQFTGQDFLNGEPMTHSEGITDAALPFIPFGKVGGAIEKTVFKDIDKVAAKETATITEQTANLSQKLGKNSITLGTPTKQIRFDLVGKAHGNVPTPHMQIYNKNFVNGVQKSISRASKEAIPITQQEIRMLRKYIEKFGN